MKFKVIHGNGFYFGGKTLEKGDSLTGEKSNGQISAGLHFRQIKEIDETAEADAEAKAKK